MPSTSPPAPASATLSPRPSAWPKAKLRDCGEEQVSTRSPSPERPINVDPRAPNASPKRRSSAKPRAIKRGDRACAEAVAGRDAAGDREHVLGRAADLDAANVGRMIEPQGSVRAARRRGRARGSSSIEASVTAVGRPAATSAAKEGPERMAVCRPGAAWPRTSVMKACVTRSIPLAQDTSGADPGAAASRSRRFAARLGRRRHQNRVAPREIVEVRRRYDRAAPERRQEADRSPASPRTRACALRPGPTGRRLGPQPRRRWRAPCPRRPAPATPITFAPFTPFRAAFLCSRNSGDASNRAGGHALETPRVGPCS